MMWAYRLGNYLPAFYACERLTNLQKQVARGFQANIHGATGTNTVSTLAADVDEAQRLAINIGWDGSVPGDIHVFAVPGGAEVMLGFLIREALTGRLFIVSPIELPHLDKFVTWDGKINSDEVGRTIAGLEGRVYVPPTKRAEHEEWRRSRKGNLWTTIDGCNVTVIPNTDRMTGAKAQFIALIRNNEGKLIKTASFQSERLCCEYVDESFYHLTESWRFKVRIAQPFGSDPDDDDDGEGTILLR